jgi:hypothetical protein
MGAAPTREMVGADCLRRAVPCDSVDILCRIFFWAHSRAPHVLPKTKPPRRVPRRSFFRVIACTDVPAAERAWSMTPAAWSTSGPEERAPHRLRMGVRRSRLKGPARLRGPYWAAGRKFVQRKTPPPHIPLVSRGGVFRAAPAAWIARERPSRTAPRSPIFADGGTCTVAAR